MFTFAVFKLSAAFGRRACPAAAGTSGFGLRHPTARVISVLPQNGRAYTVNPSLFQREGFSLFGKERQGEILRTLSIQFRDG
jgi:hypothetical protein